jgi:hypothetical protein
LYPAKKNTHKKEEEKRERERIFFWMSSDREKARLLLTRFGGDVEKAAHRLAGASEPAAGPKNSVTFGGFGGGGWGSLNSPISKPSSRRKANLESYFDDEGDDDELPTFRPGVKIVPRFGTLPIIVKSLDDPNGDGVEVIVSEEQLGGGEYGFANPGMFNGQDVAVKFIPVDPPAREDGKPVTPYTEDDFKREVKLATRAGLWGLGAKIYASGIYTTPKDEKFYILVQEKLNRIGEEDEIKVLELVKSLFFDANIHHRDTHSANVMQAGDGGLRLIDFGKAVDLDSMHEDERHTFGFVVENLIRIFIKENSLDDIIDQSTEGLPLIKAKPGVNLDERDQAFVDRINAWVMKN